MAAKKTEVADKNVVITLRIPPESKRRLNDHCAYRQREEGRTISYNQALLDLIESAPRRPPPPKPRSHAKRAAS